MRSPALIAALDVEYDLADGVLDFRGGLVGEGQERRFRELGFGLGLGINKPRLRFATPEMLTRRSPVR